MQHTTIQPAIVVYNWGPPIRDFSKSLRAQRVATLGSNPSATKPKIPRAPEAIVEKFARRATKRGRAEAKLAPVCLNGFHRRRTNPTSAVALALHLHPFATPLNQLD